MSTKITVMIEGEGGSLLATFNATTNFDFYNVAAVVSEMLEDLMPAATKARDDYDELELHLARNDAADKKSADEIDVDKNPSLKQGW